MKKVLFVILSILLVPSAFAQSKNKGYYNTTQIGLLMGNRQVNERYYYPYYGLSSLSSSYIAPYYNYNIRTELQVVPSVTMTNGYRFNEHWAAGMGLGFEIFSRNLFPVFADIQYTLWNNKVSPFFTIKTGYAFGSFKTKHYDNLNLNYEPYFVYNTDFKNCGGLMLHPEVGVKIPLSGNADLLFTVAYRHQKTKSIATQKYDNTTDYDEWIHKESLNRLSFGVGITFR